MKKHFTVIFGSSFLLMLFFQNCSQTKFSNLDELTSNVSELSLPTEPETNPLTDDTVIDPEDGLPVVNFDDCKEAAANGKLIKKTIPIHYPKSTASCPWGENGNREFSREEGEGKITARTEELRSISLETDSKLCHISLKNTNTGNIRYDDNMIMTLNGYVIASTTNFSQHFDFIRGLPKYDFLKIRDQRAQNQEQDTTYDKQFCLGRENSLSECKFPLTDTDGAIELSFSNSVIQSVLEVTSLNKVDVGLITTGDNDSRPDCKHTDLNFDVEVEFIQK